MKITLPFFLLFALSLQAQTTLYKLNGSLIPNGGESTNGIDYRLYKRYDPETVFNQSSAGFNQVWNVSGFTEIPGQKIYNNTAPTLDQTEEYPGTAMVTTGTIIDSPGEILDKVYATSGSQAITGSENTIFLLFYSTDNAEFAPFPMVYGDLHLDNLVAGDYQYGEYSGSFAGTLISEVDAYGQMTTTEGTFAVTRLKAIETLEISYPGFGVVGLFTQTTYRYYRENDLWPFVKSTNTVLDVDLLGIHQNTTHIEKAPATFLSIQNPEPNSKLAIVPNPVTAGTEIVTSGQNVLSVIVTDPSGKTVYTKKGSPHLDLSSLPTGIYMAEIQTNESTSVKKIIKK